MAKEPFNIRLKPHVYKFFIHPDHLGSNKVEIAKNSRFGEMVYNAMHRFSLLETKEASMPKWYTRQKEHKLIKITPMFDLPEYVYNDVNFLAISMQMEEIFENSFLMFVKGRMDKFPKEVESIERFMEEYDITPDEFKFDAFKKSYQRWKWRALARIKAVHVHRNTKKVTSLS